MLGNPSDRGLFSLRPSGGGNSDETGAMLHRIDFEIGIYPDRIQVTDRRSGRFVDFAAEIPFSTPRQLVAGNPVYFEHALAKALRKAMSGGFILLDAQAHVFSGGVALDDADCRTVRGALRDIGFKTVRFDQRPDDEPPPPLPASLSALL